MFSKFDYCQIINYIFKLSLFENPKNLSSGCYCSENCLYFLSHEDLFI